MAEKRNLDAELKKFLAKCQELKARGNAAHIELVLHLRQTEGDRKLWLLGGAKKWPSFLEKYDLYPKDKYPKAVKAIEKLSDNHLRLFGLEAGIALLQGCQPGDGVYPTAVRELRKEAKAKGVLSRTRAWNIVKGVLEACGKLPPSSSGVEDDDESGEDGSTRQVSMKVVGETHEETIARLRAQNKELINKLQAKNTQLKKLQAENTQLKDENKELRKLVRNAS